MHRSSGGRDRTQPQPTELPPFEAISEWLLPSEILRIAGVSTLAKARVSERRERIIREKEEEVEERFFLQLAGWADSD